MGKANLHIGAITFIHRFGANLNEHAHFHVCAVDGIFEEMVGYLWTSRKRVFVADSLRCRPDTHVSPLLASFSTRRHPAEDWGMGPRLILSNAQKSAGAHTPIPATTNGKRRVAELHHAGRIRPSNVPKELSKA